jgi:hypothetical protein
MTRNDGLLLMTVVLALYGVGNVWLVQVSSYPLWAYVGPREFHAYHVAWWHSIWGVILAPAGLLVIASVLLLWWRPDGVPGWEVWLGVALQLALVLGTALWWAPLMARLSTPEDGLVRSLYPLLLATHWLRVAIVTAYGVLTVWMLAQNAWLDCGTRLADGSR